MPDDQVRVVPAEVAQLAQTVLDSNVAFGRELGRLRASLAVPAEAFGTTGVRDYARRVLEAVSGTVEAAADVLIAVYEVDADKLYQAAFSYQEVNEKGAQKISSVISSGPGRPA
jgi:hypothetical protein